MTGSELEAVRAAYAGAGAGTALAFRELFQPAVDGWCAMGAGARRRVGSPLAMPAEDLFEGSLPPNWEVTGLDVRRIKVGRPRRDRVRVVVQGVLRSRPRGSWEVVRVPFMHIWTLRNGVAAGVTGCSDGIELQRCEGGG